jgi:hypothetical protein
MGFKKIVVTEFTPEANLRLKMTLTLKSAIRWRRGLFLCHDGLTLGGHHGDV